MANILCIGLDDTTQHARAEALRSAGHVLSQARDVRQVISACSGVKFDVVIIGQSLPTMEKLRVGEIVKQHGCRAKILELYTSREPELPAADAHLQAKEGYFETLVVTINRMLNARKSA